MALLKKELLPLVVHEERLRFDLLNGRLSVDAPAELSGEELRAAIARAGMSAVDHHEDPLACACCTPAESYWERRGRSLLTLLSGLLILAAVSLHSLSRGFTVALGAAEDHGGGMPSSALLLYLGAILAGIWFVAPRAWHSARKLSPDMNLLMFLAISGAVFIGEYFEAASVAFLFALALMLENWSVGRARRAIRGLMELAPETARIMDGASEGRELPVSEVRQGQRVLVRPGEKIPLDGRVLTGESDIDQSPLTGESMPVSRGLGDEVFAGSLNGAGVLEIEVSRTASDSTLAQILRLVEEAQSRRASSERWVERFARIYTPVMLGIALLLALLPPLLLGGGWQRWFYQALVILVIACPCALVISTPVSVVAGLARAARAGVLIKGGVFLELPARIKVWAFDKTGTLSAGRPRLEFLHPAPGLSARELLEISAALEAQSGHPLAAAVLSRAKQEGLDLKAVEDLQLLRGRGLRGDIGGQRYWIGNRRLLDERGVALGDLEEPAERLRDEGFTRLILFREEGVLGLLGVRDGLRDGAGQALAELAELGVERRVVLSGDNERVARALASEVGADEAKAELLPGDKADAVNALRSRHGACAMVGDGINDAPALATADLGIAMGAVGSDAAIETADVALMTDDLRRLPWLVRHSRRVLGVIKQNIAFALALKLIFMALAVAKLATLWMAIVADMGASLLVIANGLRLLTERKPTADDPRPAAMQTKH